MTRTEYFVRLNCTLLKYCIHLFQYIFRTSQLLCPCVRRCEDEPEESKRDKVGRFSADVLQNFDLFHFFFF